MFTVLMIIIIILGLAMMAVILMQNPKGGGLSSAFGGSSGVGSMLGVRHASDILAKSTWWMAGIFVVLVILVNMFFLPTEATQESVIQRASQEAPISPMEGQQQMQQQATENPQQAPPQGATQQAPPPPPPAE